MNKRLMFEVATNWDGADPFASSMEWHFAIASVLYAMDEHVPSEWRFRPSPLLAHVSLESLPEIADDYTISVVTNLVINDEITPDELRYAGTVLHRYEAMLDSLGLTY